MMFAACSRRWPKWPVAIGLPQQRSQQKQNSYRGLVVGIATGEEPSPAEVERLLNETRKSINDLQHNV